MPVPPVPVHPQIAALEALRDTLALKLKINRSLIGGWEISPQRDATVAVYTHQGDFSVKPGNALRASKDDFVVVLTLRGESRVTESQMYPLRDAISTILGTFTHPYVAGVAVKGWKFDILGDNTFDNVLTVNGTIDFRSVQPTYPNGDPVVQMVGFSISTILEAINQGAI
jgi:hypothetical protein